MANSIYVKPKKGMLIYDKEAKVIPAEGLKVEECKYYRSHIKDGSLEKVTEKQKKGAK